MLNQKCRIKELAKTRSGDYVLSLAVPQHIERYYDDLAEKDLRLELSIWREKRSLNANSYLHLLIGKIAEKLKLGNDEVKFTMVLEYGTVMTDDDGAKVGIKLPSSVDVKRIYPYAKWFDERMENGKAFNCYIIYKQTHALDTAEMSRLINGVVYEAKELGIETETPEQLARIISLWEAGK
jgi:hypothetical protein